MSNEQEYEAAIQAFLVEHPEWRDDFIWRTLPGEHTPTAMGRPHATEAFIWWAYERGMVTKPMNIPNTLATIRAVEPMSDAHQSGICNPETCPWCGRGTGEGRL
jgi:hypothetical protein